MTYISIVDFILVPIYLLIIFFIAYKIRNKYYPLDHPFHKFFIPGLIVKISGAVFISIIYLFYFGYGDTLTYYSGSTIINQSFMESPGTWFRLITHAADSHILTDQLYLSKLNNYQSINNYAVEILGAIIGIFCFSNFLCTVIIIATIAYSGLWVLFTVFVKLYPNLVQQSAIAALFLPSVALWGSALFKDTICMFSLCWLVYSFFEITQFKRIKVSLLLILLFNGYILFLIKPYILIAIAPILFLRFLLGIRSSFQKSSSKLIFTLFIALVFFVSYILLLNKFSKDLPLLLLENFTETVRNFSSSTLRISQDANGSGYSLGNIDGTLSNIILKIGPAINVTFFRPYLWEAGKSMTFLASLESLALLLFTVYLLFKVKFKIFRYLFEDKNLLTFLLFSLIFAFLVGITTSNFGTLSRFKIPCMPFFLMSLFIIHDYANITKKLEH